MVNKQKIPTLFQATLPIFFMILSLGLGSWLLDISIEILLLIATLFSGLLAVYLGYSWDQILESITIKVSKVLPALLILLMVGFIIGSWMIGGTIPYLVKLGLLIINPRYIVVTAFIVSAIVSLCTGTSWGSVSTIGVALMNIAISMDASLAMVAGAIVSGAYFGDKMSPLSDTTNLAAMVVGVNIYDHIKHMVFTTGPAFVIAGIVYLIIGISSESINGLQIPDTSASIAQLEGIYHFNIILLLPVAIVLYGSISKKPTVPVMFISGIVAIINAVVFHGFDVSSAFNAGVIGCQPDMFTTAGINVNDFSTDMNTLLMRGGMVSMLKTLLVALCAFAFSGVIAVSNSLEIVLNSVLKKVRKTGTLIFTTILSGIVTIGLTSNGQISILLPGELFKETYRKFGLKEINLSRTIEDSVTVIEPLIPWTMAGLFMSETLGVTTLEYLPYAIVCYTGLVFAIIWGFTGITIAKIEDPKSIEVTE